MATTMVVLMGCCVAEGVGRRYDDMETMVVVREDGDRWPGRGGGGGKRNDGGKKKGTRVKERKY